MIKKFEEFISELKDGDILKDTSGDIFKYQGMGNTGNSELMVFQARSPIHCARLAR